MSALKLVQESIKTRGIYQTLTMVLSYIVDYMFDKRYGLDTWSWIKVNDLDIEVGDKQHASHYQPTHALPLKMLFKKLNFQDEKNIIDIGCGKGKVMIVASKFGFKEVRGVEISPMLCKISCENLNRYQKKTNQKFTWKVTETNALTYQFNDDEDVFFLFNPFNDFILETVIKNIQFSLKRRNRKIWIIYNNPVHKKIIENNLDNIMHSEFSYWGHNYSIFEIN